MLSGETIQMPAFSGWESDKLGMLMPFLFITVACGACSGFHSIVSSGTTSKQIKKESDVRRISYGGMLVEGILAVFAMGCVAVLTMSEREAGGTPVGIFATGAAKFFGAVGIPVQLGAEFAILAISTFLLTTLDTCTRLTRFLIEELFSGGMKRADFSGRYWPWPCLLSWSLSNSPQPMAPCNPHGKPSGPCLGPPINYLPPLLCLPLWSF